MTSRCVARLFVLLFALLLMLNPLPGFHTALAQGAASPVISDHHTAGDLDGDHTAQRAAWFARGREAPTGQSAAALRLRAVQQKMVMRAARNRMTAPPRSSRAQTAIPGGALQPLAGAASQGWVALGPAPLSTDPGTYGYVSGRVTAVAVDPSDPTGNTVYAGGASGGVWKSINGAAPTPTDVSWKPLTDQQLSLATGAISVEPGASKPVVLVGTGEPNNALDSYYGVGILRSSDGGTNWNLIKTANPGLSFLGLGFSKFAWSPVTTSCTTAQPCIVVAATATTSQGFDDGAITASTARGLYRSADAGQTWTYQALTDGSLPISATDVVYNAAAGKFFAAIRYHGLYSSSDGTNWTRLASQPGPGLTASLCPTLVNGTLSSPSTCQLYRAQLAVVPGRNDVYVWYIGWEFSSADNQYELMDQGIWRSADGGQTWLQIDETGLTNCGDTDGCGTEQGFYNLTLAALPDGSETDVYAGAVNLYKCTLADTHANVCSGDSWLNLTHVYGCPSIAGVHPNQHGLDFVVTPAVTAVMYFANDGGVYRALDGYSGLTSGTCGVDNLFDDLNASTVPGGTIGSLTELVSFSIDPTARDTLLGGAQGNGSPATASATNSTLWAETNNGDGGYNAINPSDPSQWFTSHDYVSIELCHNGPLCTSADFNANQLVSSSTLGGDVGALYTPFILDPQNTGEMLIGTCRVWRGPATTGSGFSALSVDFDTLSNSAVCTGGEVNLVRALAAGGPLDTNGFSTIVYAATEGTGPNCSAANLCYGPAGGEVWVTTNASTTPMANVTGAIDPQNFTISSVAIDDSDPNWKTAYVSLMGFGASHVFKTIDAGGTGQASDWTDWSGVYPNSLPSAPVNALLVDSGAGQIYAGTDIGVFVSSTISPAWTEVIGSSPVFLPNVPVTALRIFNPNANTKVLRASTYGRGVWEYTLVAGPDYQIAISNTPQSVLSAQTATFNGTLTGYNGYNSPVNLTCAGNVPPTCTLSATELTPTPAGVPFTVTASGPAADYNFRIHGAGTDSYTIAHDAAATLHVIDFSLTAPNPATISALQGQTSNSTGFQVLAGGSFSGTVVLSCANLPAKATCSFSPSPRVSPTAGNPATVSLAVSVAPDTPAVTTTVTLQGTTSGVVQSQTFALTVVAPDLGWAVKGSGAVTVLAGASAIYQFTATPGSGSFATNVTFACNAESLPALAACTFSPSQIAAGVTGAQPVQVTISTVGPNSGNSHASSASGTGIMADVRGSKRTRGNRRLPWPAWALPLAGVLVVGFGQRHFRRHYSISVMAAALALTGMFLACQSVTKNADQQPPPPPQITISPTTANLSLGGSQQFTANEAVTWSLGAGALGSIDSNGLYTAPTSGTTPASFTVTANASGQSQHATVNINPVEVNVGEGSPASVYPSNPGWPAQTAQFNATVAGAANMAVTWAVSTPYGGSIDANAGLYTAPPITQPTLPSTVTITATSVADPTKSGSATETILPATQPGTYSIAVSATDTQGTQAQAVSLTVQ